ncbi:hypothetical protein [Hoylesella marshii]|uniref:hypothetical protein n=1 Tax=Hoylesella marshii TaxID=189722 RepID=UPI0028D62E4F|nr:hypothetical protein [Hoylesella marshii]
MKQEFMKFSLLAVVFTLFTACSKENNDENTEEPIKGITFSMSEAPYNADMEMAGSRASTDKVIKDTFTINGVEAEVTLERDTEQPKQETRVITSGNHYTIVAFKAGTNTEVASTKGYFDGTGKFIYDAGSTPIQLSPANYDFVCYTHQYATRSGNTIEVPLQYADKAFVCKQLVTITHAKKQEIAFTMKHAGARVRTKLVSIEAPSTSVDAYLGYRANKAPTSTVYDMTTGTFAASTTPMAQKDSISQSYTSRYDEYDPVLGMYLRISTGFNYLNILPGTKPEDLFYRIKSGNLYNTTLNTKQARAFKAGNAFEANGAYTLTIRLMPSYLYLFEDGQTGHLKDADRKDHVPIAIVFDAVGKRAISLWDANGGVKTKWDADDSNTQYVNSKAFPTLQEALSNSTSGKVWTWESWDSFHDGTSIVKVDYPRFEAYYYAGNFYTSTDLTNHLSGKTLASSLNKRNVWYLPSYYEWKEVFAKLGFGNGSLVTSMSNYQWKGDMVNYAFIAANGTPTAASMMQPTYWSSSEYSSNNILVVYMDRMYMTFSTTLRWWDRGKVRPFVAY